MKYKNTLSLALAFTLLFNGATYAATEIKNTDKVVAVVSGSVITQQDLNQRFEFLKRQIRKQIPAEQIDSLYKKTLDDLVNEEVQRQYAVNNGIIIQNNEVELAIAEIEKRNNMTHGAFFNLAHGLIDTAKAKISASLTRQKIIDKKLRPRIIVSKGEVDRLLKSINNGKNNWEKEAHQIFIAHSEGTSDAEMEKRIKNITAQFSAKDIDFQNLAKKFDESATVQKSESSYLGWFSAGELSPALNESLINLEKGNISKPIATTNGWHILYVSNIKKTQKFSSEPITEYQLFKYQVNLNDVDDKKLTEKSFRKEIKKMERLGDIEEASLKHIDNSAYKGSGSLGWVATSSLTSELNKKISKLDINDFSSVITNGDTLEVYYLSDKRDVLPKQLQLYRNRLQARIMNNRLELAAKRFVRDLRRQAYVELRL